MSPLRRLFVIIPLSLLLGLFLVYGGLNHGLHRSHFGPVVDVRVGYNALGRIRPMNMTAPMSWEKKHGGKKAEVVPDGMKVKDLAIAVENGTLGVSQARGGFTWDGRVNCLSSGKPSSLIYRMTRRKGTRWSWLRPSASWTSTGWMEFPITR